MVASNTAANGHSIPEVCRAAVCVNSGPDYELVLKEDFPVPKPGPGELLVKLNATGICLSDHHYMEGDWVAGKMTGRISCVGHEGAGVVVALGPEVDSKKWKIGERVGMKPIWSICNECSNCRDGHETHCEDRQWAAFHKDGSYAEYVVLHATYTNKLPDGVPDEYAGPVMCSGATVWAALKSTGARAGQWIVIPGAGGGVGHMAVQYARAMGLRVIAIDTGASKKEMCEKLGAEAFIDFRETSDTAEQVKKITEKGAHAVIITGGTKAAYTGTLKFLRNGGTVVGVGLPPKETAFFGGFAEEIIRNRLTVTGTLVGTSNDVDQALDFVARGAVTPHVTIKPFEYFPQAVKDLVQAKVVGRLVVQFRDQQ